IPAHLPTDGGNGECGARVPAPGENGSAGSGTDCNGLHGQPGIAMGVEFDPSGIEDGVFECGASASFLHSRNPFRLRCEVVSCCLRLGMIDAFMYLKCE